MPRLVQGMRQLVEGQEARWKCAKLPKNSVFIHVLPFVVDPSNIFLLPLLQIKDVHPISPTTSIRIKVPSNMWIRKINILVKTVETLPTGLHSAIDLSIKINLPQPCQIFLHNYVVIKEKYLIQLWIDLWKIESQVVQHREVLGVPVLQVRRTC
uniref:Glycosyltransferase n=1 Tax=Arundo donax TaxID=35708 RepID=A0A0A9GHZ9_ARUDO